MAVVDVKSKVIILKFSNGEKEIQQVTTELEKVKGETVLFKHSDKNGEYLIIAHKNDIISIRIKTWDNIRKVEGTRKVTLEELQEHLKSLDHGSSDL